MFKKCCNAVLKYVCQVNYLQISQLGIFLCLIDTLEPIRIKLQVRGKKSHSALDINFSFCYNFFSVNNSHLNTLCHLAFL